MKCIECGHDVVSKKKTYVANLENCVIIVKNVPSEVCEHCERYIIPMRCSESLKRLFINLRA